MGFELDPAYKQVPERIADFERKHPEGSLRPLNPERPFWVETIGEKVFICYAAAAYRTPDDQAPGVGLAWEPWPGKTPYTKDSELQNAETSAWGRAIVAALASQSKSVASAEDMRNRQEDHGPQAPNEQDRRNLAFRRIKDVIGGDEERMRLAQTVAELLGVVMTDATADEAEEVAGRLVDAIKTGELPLDPRQPGELPESPQSPQEPPGAVVAVKPGADTAQAIRDATEAQWVPNANEAEEFTNALAERRALLKKAATIVESTSWLEDGLRAVLGHKGKKSISKAFAEMRLTDLRTAVELIQAAATKEAFAAEPGVDEEPGF